ncbi:hypothetical protein ACWEO4_45275 [Streptomyces sp. NPDC004393]
MSGTRAVLGLVGLMFYISQYADRDYLFGPDAVLPWREFVAQLHNDGSFSLYAWSSSEAWFQLVFHLGLIQGSVKFRDCVEGWRSAGRGGQQSRHGGS